MCSYFKAGFLLLGCGFVLSALAEIPSLVFFTLCLLLALAVFNQIIQKTDVQIKRSHAFRMRIHVAWRHKPV